MAHHARAGARSAGSALQALAATAGRRSGARTGTMQKTEPIAAIATAPGRGGIGVVRLSGPDLTTFMNRLVGRRLPPRRAVLSDFRGMGNGVIDRGIAVYFPAPHSYTGEDVLELQGHGGIVVMQLLLQRCLGLGARIAEPGEFTRRAYLNDKLDLAQAESCHRSDRCYRVRMPRALAMRSLQGAFSVRINEFIRELTATRPRRSGSRFP